MSRAALRIAFVGTYPPTQCGIATFTESLRSAVRDAEAEPPLKVATGVIQLVDELSPVRTPGVVADWVRGDPLSMGQAVEAANRYDCVILQHEFGIFGGRDGEDVIDFAQSCLSPIIAVLHTVVAKPSSNQRRVIESLGAIASTIVVQTEAARSRLLATTTVTVDRVVVIPHGAAANFENRPPTASVEDAIVLTWGLVGPGKGIEHGIRAIAELSRRGTTPSYIVLGRTHPKVLETQGEQYREGLIRLAADLGVADKVRFDDTYRDWASLREQVRKADVVLLPYDSRDQVTSGVLVEAVASGRAIVATAFPHALEVADHGAGLAVAHGDPLAMADALESVLGDPDHRAVIEANARDLAKGLLWPRVGAEYLSYARAAAATAAVA